VNLLDVLDLNEKSAKTMEMLLELSKLKIALVIVSLGIQVKIVK